MLEVGDKFSVEYEIVGIDGNFYRTIQKGTAYTQYVVMNTESSFKNIVRKPKEPAAGQIWTDQHNHLYKYLILFVDSVGSYIEYESLMTGHTVRATLQPNWFKTNGEYISG